MDSYIQSFEASLLGRRPFELADAATLRDLHDILGEYGDEFVQRDRIDGAFLLFTSDTVQVLIGLSDTPLPVEHFLEAARPAAANQSEARILRLLATHSATATILVGDMPGTEARQPPDHAWTKQQLCWDIADWLSTVSQPDLVFWCLTDTLYTADEFDRACDFRAAQGDVAAACAAPAIAIQPLGPGLPAHFAQDPVIGTEVPGWIDDPDAPRCDDDAGGIRSLKDLLPGQLGWLASGDSPGGRRLMHGASMMMSSTTIGLVGLGQLGTMLS